MRTTPARNAVIDSGNHLSPNAINKQWAAKQFIEERETSKSLAKRFGVPPRTIRKWPTKQTQGVLFRETSGRPPRLSEDALVELKDVIASSANQSKALRLSETRELVDAIVLKYGASGGNREVSAPTLKKALTTIKAVQRTPQTTTAARAIATNDLRNYLSMTAALQSFQSDGYPVVHNCC